MANIYGDEPDILLLARFNEWYGLEKEQQMADKLERFLTPRGELLVAHREQWLYCSRCGLGNLAINHVLYDDTETKPLDRPDILFIGEAPGPSEDAVGMPFIGASGKLLRQAISASVIPDKTYVISNTVACKPQDSVGGKFREPTNREILACAPRLIELIKAYNPKVIVLLGSVARSKVYPTVLESGFTGLIRNAVHPSYILRQGGLQSSTWLTFCSKINGFFREAKSVK